MNKAMVRLTKQAIFGPELATFGESCPPSTAPGHSAASQTVARMAGKGLLTLESGADARERLVRLTPKARKMLPRLMAQWTATNAAAAALNAELPCSLHDVLVDAIHALERKPFRERVTPSARHHDKKRRAAVEFAGKVQR